MGSARAPLQDRRILLVDDESMVLMLVEDMLLSLGAAHVETAMDLDEAKGLAERVDVDLAVLDVNLAGRKSYPIAETLRARGVPFLFATGYGSKGHDEAWRGILTLAKPFEVQELARAIERALLEPS